MPRFVPVTLGSPRFHTLELDGFLVTEARFPPGAILPRHAHDRACFAVMLNGAFDAVFKQATLECVPGTVSTEPAEEVHSNRVGEAGAHVLVVQPDPRQLDRLRPYLTLLDRVDYFPRSPVAGLAWRLCRELHVRDDVSPLAAEGLILEMLALAARNHPPPGEQRQVPSWLRRAHELLRSRFLEPLRVMEIARAVDVHPVHLARSFRRHFGMSPASYLRRLRLDWTARRVASTDEPLVQIATAAGFADQSHFTRAFRRHCGETPSAYRQATRK